MYRAGIIKYRIHYKALHLPLNLGFMQNVLMIEVLVLTCTCVAEFVKKIIPNLFLLHSRHQ